MGDMSTTFADNYQWNEGDTKVVIQQLLHGLVAMHKEGITHRDLKPAVSTPLPRPNRYSQMLTVTRTYSSASQRISPSSSVSKSLTLAHQNASHPTAPPHV